MPASLSPSSSSSSPSRSSSSPVTIPVVVVPVVLIPVVLIPIVIVPVAVVGQPGGVAVVLGKGVPRDPYGEDHGDDPPNPEQGSPAEDPV